MTSFSSSSAGPRAGIPLLLSIVLLLCVANVRAFHVSAFTRARVASTASDRRASAIINNQRFAVKPDLFSDDLFEDDEEQAAKPSQTKDSKNKAAAAADLPKRQYLDEKWKLNSEDAKDFQGFPRKGAAADAASSSSSSIGGDDDVVENLPVFALLYKFKAEHVESSVESVLADHKGHCANFKRLLNTEVIRLGKARGVVMLWTGLSEGDKVETKAEITKFLEEDPFIMKDYVQNWDLIDLSDSENEELLELEKGELKDALPGK